MNRREFSRRLLASGAAVVLPGALRAVGAQDGLLVDGDRLLENFEALKRFGATPQGGISRVAYSDADLAGREFAVGLLRQAGLEVSTDLVGNVVGKRAATGTRAPLMLGSHIDSVPHGGNYDGQVGSMSAIEVARTLFDAGIALRHPLEVVLFQNEEGGKTGSRAMSGEVAPGELELVTASGYTIGDGIARLGGDPTRIAETQRNRGDVAAFFELHIEQGATLERRDITIGVVEGIVGIKRWNIIVTGSANHAGTTPMDQRQDALLAAGRFIDLVHQTVRSIPGTQVATVGKIEAHPGAPNVIAGRVDLTLEIRDLAMDKIDIVFEAIRGRTAAVEQTTATAFEYNQFYESRAAPTDERLRSLVETAATALRLSHVRMPSGAGHDAQSIAHFAPVGMIFVPSRSGISHSPDEFTTPEHLVAGANVLLRSILLADAMDWEG